MMWSLAGLLIRVVIGGLLTLGGVGKLVGGRRERDKWLKAYGLVPDPLVPAIALAIPSLELASGSALVLGFMGRVSLAISFGLLLVITGAATITLARGGHPDCGCFGRWARDQLSWQIVGRNLVLISLLAGVGGAGLTELGVESLPIAGQFAATGAMMAGALVVPRIVWAGPWARRSAVSAVSALSAAASGT